MKQTAPDVHVTYPTMQLVGDLVMRTCCSPKSALTQCTVRLLGSEQYILFLDWMAFPWKGRRQESEEGKPATGQNAGQELNGDSIKDQRAEERLGQVAKDCI